MTAPINSHQRRFRLSEAIAGFLSDRGPKQVGLHLGLDRGTVADKGGDLHKWRADELIEVAQHSEEIANALVATVRPDPVRRHGEAIRLRAELLRELSEHAELDRKILDQIDRSTPEGRRAIREAIDRLRHGEAELLADLDAMERP